MVAAGAAVKDEASELGRRVGVQVRNGSLKAWVEREQDWVMVLVRTTGLTAKTVDLTVPRVQTLVVVTGAGVIIVVGFFVLAG